MLIALPRNRDLLTVHRRLKLTRNVHFDVAVLHSIILHFHSRIACFDSFALFKIDLSVSGSNVSAKDRGSWSRSWNARTFGNFVEEIIFRRRSLVSSRLSQIQLSIMNSSFALHWSWARKKRRRRRFGWQSSGTLSDSQRYECRRTVPVDGLQFTSNRIFS